MASRSPIVLLAACALFSVPGCSVWRGITGQNVISPSSPKDHPVYLTPEQAQAEHDLIAAQKAQERADIAAKAETAKNEAIADTAIAISHLNSETSAKADDLRNDLSHKIGRITADLQSMLAARKIESDKFDQQYANAITNAVKQTDTIGAGVNIVAGFAQGSGIPGLVLGGSLLTAIAAGVFGVVKGKQASTAKSDLKDEQDAHATTLAKTERVVDSLDIAQDASPEFKTAFEKIASLLKDWQGEAASALVKTLQVKPLDTKAA